MSQTLVVSKLINEIQFKINESSYKKCQDRIKRMAGLWTKSTEQMNRSMVAGKKIAAGEIKQSKRADMALQRQMKSKKETLRADNIRHQHAIKNSLEFRQQLQKTNAAFLQGTISAKERAATIGQLTKQYKQLNASASTYNKHSNGLGAIRGVSRGLGGMTRAGLLGGAAAVGVGGYAATSGFNAVKQEGQQFESLIIQIQNTFGERAQEMTTIIRNMADANGNPILELGNNLVEFVALMKPLGVSVDDAIRRFQQTSDAMQSYGIGGERAVGFQQQLTQALDQGTLDSFKEAFAWAPQLRADLLKYVQQEMNVSQKEFLGGLTNGKFNLKDTWFKFLSANESKYSTMSAKFKTSSMAQDARVGNQLSTAIFRIFDSTGFKTAMAQGAKIVSDWASLLEQNSAKIGEIFGNLYTIVSQLSKEGFEGLTKWLQELTAEDIKVWFGDLKTTVSEFIEALKNLAAFINDFVPERFKQNKQSTSVPEDKRKNYDADIYGKSYVQKERELLNSGLEPSAAARQAEQFAQQQSLKIKVPQLGFQPNTINLSPRTLSGGNGYNGPTNFSGSMQVDLKVDVNDGEFGKAVEARIENNNYKQINLISN